MAASEKPLVHERAFPRQGGALFGNRFDEQIPWWGEIMHKCEATRPIFGFSDGMTLETFGFRENARRVLRKMYNSDFCFCVFSKFWCILQTRTQPTGLAIIFSVYRVSCTHVSADGSEKRERTFLLTRIHLSLLFFRG